MEYYIVLLVFYAITLIFLRLVFAEIEGKQARKMSNVRYFLRYHSKFVYRNQFSIIFVAFLCYMIVSVEKAFSTMWFLQLLGFIAVGVISDALSQIVYYYYINFRFKKDIVESEELKNEIEQAVLNQGEELMQQRIPSYEPHRIIEDYLKTICALPTFLEWTIFRLCFAGLLTRSRCIAFPSFLKDSGTSMIHRTWNSQQRDCSGLSPDSLFIRFSG